MTSAIAREAVRGSLCLVLFAFSSTSGLFAQAAPGGAVSGRITGAPAGDTVPLPYAVIEVLDDQRRSTVADEDGYYTLLGLPEGFARIRVIHSGHNPLELVVVVPAAETLRLNLHLTGTPVDMGEIEVEGQASQETSPVAGEVTADVARLEAEALRTTTGMAELGLVAAARRGSGNDPPDATGLLFMRGSTADLKLVLLDGAPIHTPFHLGGLLDPIQPTTVGQVRLFLGGAPARYNGGISHILEIETRRPEGGPAKGELSADLMGLSGVVEKQVGRFGVLASGRSLHGLGNAIMADGQQPYGYSDGLVRTDLALGAGHLSVTGFRNEESVNLDPLLGLQNQGLAPSGSLAASGLPSADAAWSNAVLSARYHTSVSRWSVKATAALSDYDARLPVGETTLTILGGSSNKTHFAVDANRPTRWGAVSLGVSFDDIRVKENIDVVVGPNPGLSSRSMQGRGAGAYAEASRNLGGVTLRAGLRGDAFEGHDRMEFSPRASVLWPLSETALFRIAAGRYTQHTRRSDPAIQSQLGIQSPGFETEPLLAVATATHLVASLDQQLTPSVTVGLEGFVKSFNDLPDALGDRVNSSGMDLRIARAEGATFGWLGYTLNWLWADSGSLANASFSGHHLVTAGLSGPFTGFLEGAVRLSYGSGLPFSSVPFGDAASVPDSGLEGSVPSTSQATIPVPEESFLRLDLTLSGKWTIREEVNRSWVLSPYMRVLNALDRRDSLFYYFEPWRTDSPRPLTELPVLPILGLRFSF